MIEDRIEKELENYQIKTRSEDILSRLPRKKEKKKFNFKLVFSLSSALAVAACVLIFVIALNPFANIEPNVPIPNTNTTLNKLTDSSTNVSVLTFQLFYSGAMTTKMGGDTYTNTVASAYSEEQLFSIVDNINKSYDIIDEMYSNKDGLAYEYKQERFTYEGVVYNYMLHVSDYTLYIVEDVTFDEDDDDEEESELEWESSALFKIGDNYAYGEIEMEMEGEETSIELKYFDGDYTYSVERDYEKQDYSMEYVIYYAGNVIEKYEVEMDYKNDNNFKCDYEYENIEQTILINIKTIKNENGYTFKYKEEVDGETIHDIDNVIATQIEGKRVYKIGDQELEIIL